jgi:hypothetical protein
MKKSNISKFLFLASSSLFMFAAVQAQGDKPSPAATSTGKVGGETITIKYISPAVKGRDLGFLVPYDKVWRAGLNDHYLRDKPIKVEENPFRLENIACLPPSEEWTIILNSQTGQWGSNRAAMQTAILRRCPHSQVKPEKERNERTPDLPLF